MPRLVGAGDLDRSDTSINGERGGGGESGSGTGAAARPRLDRHRRWRSVCCSTRAIASCVRCLLFLSRSSVSRTSAIGSRGEILASSFRSRCRSDPSQYLGLAGGQVRGCATGQRFREQGVHWLTVRVRCWVRLRRRSAGIASTVVVSSAVSVSHRPTTLPETLGPHQQSAVVDQRRLHPDGVQHRVVVRIQSGRCVAGLVRVNPLSTTQHLGRTTPYRRHRTRGTSALAHTRKLRRFTVRGAPLRRTRSMLMRPRDRGGPHPDTQSRHVSDDGCGPATFPSCCGRWNRNVSARRARRCRHRIASSAAAPRRLGPRRPVGAVPRRPPAVRLRPTVPARRGLATGRWVRRRRSRWPGRTCPRSWG